MYCPLPLSFFLLLLSISLSLSLSLSPHPSQVTTSLMPHMVVLLNPMEPRHHKAMLSHLHRGMLLPLKEDTILLDNPLMEDTLHLKVCNDKKLMILSYFLAQLLQKEWL